MDELYYRWLIIKFIGSNFDIAADNGNHFDFPLSLSSSYRLLVDSLAKAAILFDKLDSSNNWGNLITKYPELRDSSGKLITSGEVCVLYALLYIVYATSDDDDDDDDDCLPMGM